MISMSLNDIYKKALKDLMINGHYVKPRGIPAKEILGYRFELDDPTDNVITLKGFETNVAYAAEELKWYLSGSNRIDFSPRIKRVWKQYSDDGTTANSAYGFYLFKQHPLSQWKWCLDKLRHDRDSRQAVININQPYHKYGRFKGATADFPCTMYVQLLIRDGKLVWITNIRSNDIYLGFRNDVYCFTELQKIAAQHLDCGVGQYLHFAGSLHLYAAQFEKVRILLA